MDFSIEIREMLIKREIEYTEVNDNFMISCPLHEDKNPSFGIRYDGVYHCFSCGIRGGFTELLSIFNESRTFTFLELVKRKLEIRNNISEIKNIELPSDFRTYDTIPDSVFNRISEKNIRKYGIGDAVRSFPGYFLIPIISESYESYACRHLLKDPGMNYKRWLFPKNFQKTIFPIPKRKFILTEGIIASFRVEDYGYESSCAFGHFLSTKQVNYLIQRKVEEITILFDSYESHYKESLTKVFFSLYPLFKIFVMKLERDADETSINDFENSYKNRINLSDAVLQQRQNNFMSKVRQKIQI